VGGRRGRGTYAGGALKADALLRNKWNGESSPGSGVGVIWSRRGGGTVRVGEGCFFLPVGGGPRGPVSIMGSFSQRKT